MKSILFVCTGNIFRSMSAEYCLKKRMRRKIYVSSAGTVASFAEAAPQVVSELKKFKIDVGKHRQQRLSQKLVDSSTLVVAMAVNHQKFIKKKFGVNVPLFDEICFGKKISVPDINEAIIDYKHNLPAVEIYEKGVVDFIYDSIPLFMRNMGKFMR
jgi:protein-tyrosine phosphatase